MRCALSALILLSLTVAHAAAAQESAPLPAPAAQSELEQLEHTSVELGNTDVKVTRTSSLVLPGEICLGTFVR